MSNALVDALLSQCRVGVGVCDANGRLTEFNTALESMMGPALCQSSQQEWAQAYYLFDASGRRPLDSGEVPLVRALVGETVTDVAITTRRPGQPVRYLRWAAAPLHEGDQTTGAVVLVTEVAEHHDDPAATVDAQLTRYWQRISRLQELSSRVATIADHQIRTPLTVIQAHLELLEDALDDLPGDAHRAVHAIRRGVTSLTEALTALARANDLANAADPTLEAVDLVDVARRASRLVQASHPMLRVHLRTGTTSYVPTNADSLWVRRAIAALTEALVETEFDTDVALDILDDGDTVGVSLFRLGRDPISATDLTDTWTSHGDASTSPRSLGLALAEAVALAHDGRLEITQTPTGLSATLLLSRVPQPPPQHLSTATRQAVT